MLAASRPSPFVGGVVIFDAALHVLQLVQDSEHVDELAQREEVGLRDEVLPPLGVAQALHLAAEPLDGLALEGSGTRSPQQGLAHTQHHLHPPLLPCPDGDKGSRVSLHCHRAMKQHFKPLQTNVLSAGGEEQGLNPLHLP